MKNNKGFSVLELIVSFSLTITVIAILFELVIVMKNLYDENNVRTQLLNNKNLLTDLIYTDINNKELTEINLSNSDNVNSLEFTFGDGTQKTLKWGYGISTSESNHEVNMAATVSYGDYVVTYPSKTTFAYDDSNYEIDENGIVVSGVKQTYHHDLDSTYIYYNYEIPIYNSKFKDTDFGLDILYVTDNYINIMINGESRH